MRSSRTCPRTDFYRPDLRDTELRCDSFEAAQYCSGDGNPHGRAAWWRFARLSGWPEVLSVTGDELGLAKEVASRVAFHNDHTRLRPVCVPPACTPSAPALLVTRATYSPCCTAPTGSAAGWS